jgi:hypothetical protein
MNTVFPTSNVVANQNRFHIFRNRSRIFKSHVACLERKKILIAKLGELKPIACIDHEGKEHNLLAAPEVIQNVVASQEKNPLSSFSIVPQKRKKLTEDYLPEVPFPSIRNIILNSQCRSLLLKSNYIEIDHQVAFWLNCSWTLYPSMAQTCARLLERMIFVEKNKSLLTLGGEIYSRLPSLDAHYEKTSSAKKENIPQSSLPHINTRYENIEVVLMDHDNAKKN